MSHQILLYVSAGPDLAAEREVLGRAITEIPVDLGWRIFQTPASGRLVDREAVELADIHLFLLGSDVRAPIGFEWTVARQAERWPIPLLKGGVGRTPAAWEYARFIGFQRRWFPFEQPADLRRRALRLLSAFILFKMDELQLSLVEIQTLLGWRKRLSDRPVDVETIGGAAEGGVLLSKERYRPVEGVPLHGKQDSKKDEFWPDIDLDWLDLDAKNADQGADEEGPDWQAPSEPTISLN